MTNEKLLELLNKGQLDKLKYELECNIMADNFKKSGRKTSTAAIVKRVLKNSIAITGKTQCPYNDYFCVTDGRIILSQKGSFGILTCEPEKQLNFKKIFDGISVDNQNMHTTVDVEFLRYFKSKFGKTEQRYITLRADNSNYIAFDCNLLLDAVDFTGESTLKINNRYSPCLLGTIDETDIFSVVMPCQCPDYEKSYNFSQEVFEEYSKLKNN